MSRAIAPLNMQSLMDAMTDDQPRDIEASPDGTIRYGGFVLTPRGLVIPEYASIEEWEGVGQLLKRLEGSLQWLVGDWSIGLEQWGNKYEGIIDRTGYAYGTLRNLAVVCRAIDLSRRRDKLSFGHHAEVAKLPPADQDAWLDYAEQNRISVRKLRNLIAGKTDDDDAPVLTPEMKHAKHDAAYIMNETASPGWENNRAIRAEVKLRAGRLAVYFSNLAKRL